MKLAIASIFECLSISTYRSKRIIIVGPNEDQKAAIAAEYYPLCKLKDSFLWMIRHFSEFIIILFKFHFEQDIKSIMTQQLPCIAKMVLDELGSTHLAEGVQELVQNILSNLIEKGIQLADSKFFNYQIVLLLQLLIFFWSLYFKPELQSCCDRYINQNTMMRMLVSF